MITTERVLNTRSPVDTVEASRHCGKVLETLVPASEAQSFTLNFGPFFTYFPSLGCKYFHFNPEVVKTTDQKSIMGLHCQADFCQMDSSLGVLSEISMRSQKSV